MTDMTERIMLGLPAFIVRHAAPYCRACSRRLEKAILAEILTQCMVPLETVAGMTATDAGFFRFFIRSGRLHAVMAGGHCYLSGKFLLALLTDRNGNLHLNDSYHRPLTPADILGAIGEAEDNDHAHGDAAMPGH